LHYLDKSDQAKHVRVEMNKKTPINTVYPDLSPPKASKLQDLTVVQQCVYQTTFRNVYEFKKQLMKSGLVWSKTLSTLSMNGESTSVSVFAQWANISINSIADS